MTKFKALADDKINVTERFEFVLGLVEYSWEEENMLVTQYFIYVPKCFQKPPSSGSLKVQIVRSPACVAHW